jgi:hypothetical protein
VDMPQYRAEVPILDTSRVLGDLGRVSTCAQCDGDSRGFRASRGLAWGRALGAYHCRA